VNDRSRSPASLRARSVAANARPAAVPSRGRVLLIRVIRIIRHALRKAELTAVGARNLVSGSINDAESQAGLTNKKNHIIARARQSR